MHAHGEGDREGPSKPLGPRPQVFSPKIHLTDLEVFAHLRRKPFVTPLIRLCYGLPICSVGGKGRGGGGERGRGQEGIGR